MHRQAFPFTNGTFLVDFEPFFQTILMEKMVAVSVDPFFFLPLKVLHTNDTRVLLAVVLRWHVLNLLADWSVNQLGHQKLVFLPKLRMIKYLSQHNSVNNTSNDQILLHHLIIARDQRMRSLKRHQKSHVGHMTQLKNERIPCREVLPGLDERPDTLEKHRNQGHEEDCTLYVIAQAVLDNDVDHENEADQDLELVHFDFTVPHASSEVSDVQPDHETLDVVAEEGNEVKHAVVDADAIALHAEQDVGVDVEHHDAGHGVFSHRELFADLDHVEDHSYRLESEQN
jgi:hypothetical protein